MTSTGLPRRRFLSAAAIGSGAAAAGLGGLTLGCGAAMHPELSASETNALLTRLERGITGIRSTPAGSLASAHPWQLRPDAAESILRLGLEAAVVTDVARSIPSDRRVPRELGQVLTSHLPIL